MALFFVGEMTMAREYKIELIRGDTFEFDVQISDIEDNVVSSIYFSCKQKISDTSYAFQKSFGNGITDSGNNRYHVRVVPGDTKNLDPGLYIYDLQVGLNGEDAFTVLKGNLVMIQEVTEETP